MKTIHILTEEASLENVLKVVLPTILPGDITFKVHPHNGKQDLEKAIQYIVPALSKIPNSRILIVRDQDSADCRILKQELLNLTTPVCSSPFLVRIVCHELENWFLGDLEAIQAAFPRFKADNYRGKSKFRSPDTIRGAVEELRRIIPQYASRQYLPKLEVSEKIAAHMVIDRNKSISFQQFMKGVIKLATNPAIPDYTTGD